MRTITCMVMMAPAAFIGCLPAEPEARALSIVAGLSIADPCGTADEVPLGEASDDAPCAVERRSDAFSVVRFGEPRLDYPWTVDVGAARGEAGRLVASDVEAIEAADLELVSSLGIDPEETRATTRHTMAIDEDEGVKSKRATGITTWFRRQIDGHAVKPDRVTIARTLQGSVKRLVVAWNPSQETDETGADVSLAAATAYASTVGAEAVEAVWLARGPALVLGARVVHSSANDDGSFPSMQVAYFVDGEKLD